MNQLQKLNSQQANLQNQVSTGQRITLPSDDSAAMGRVLKYSEEKQRLQQYAKNGAQALDVNQTTYSALEDLKKLSDRAGELGVLGQGINGTTDAQSYAKELNQLIEQGVQTVNSSYAGQHLFGGAATTTPPFTAQRDASGNITGVTYAGAATSPEFHIGEGATISPYTSATTNQQLGDFLNNLVTMRNALQTGDSATIQAAQPGLQTSEDHLLGAVTDVGATQTRLEAANAQNSSRFSELDKLTSSDTDADLSSTIVKLTQTQTAYQAALQVGAQVLRVSLLDYLH